MKTDETPIRFSLPDENLCPEQYYRQGGSELDRFVAQIRLDNRRKMPIISLDEIDFKDVYRSKAVRMFTATIPCEGETLLVDLCNEVERCCPDGIDTWNGIVVQFCIMGENVTMEHIAAFTEWLALHKIPDSFHWGIYLKATKPSMARVIVYKDICQET